VPIVAVPLILVCWFTLFLLIAALTEERSRKSVWPSCGLLARAGRPVRSGRAIVLVLLARRSVG